ncbi:MAG: M48 family metalloprotease [Alphaproteobacteria bacterium]
MKDERIKRYSRTFSIRRVAFCIVLSFICSFSIISSAQAVPLIRDAEIEHTLRLYANPVFKAAGLRPQSVNIFIVNRDDLNAFVAGGSNMFIHAGLILASDDPAMLIGVMAHETGHIAGGHLAQGAEKLKNAQIGTVLSYVLGAAAAVATNKPEVGAAVITGGSTSAARTLLAYSRANEESADQAALKYLDSLQISASGLHDMFIKLQRNERLHSSHPDPYMLTHPLSNSRIEHVRSHMEDSNIAKGAYPTALELAHQRMVAKLFSFMKTPERTFQRYRKTDTSVAARLAHAVAYYKMPDLPHSLEKIDSLLQDYPDDAFFHELKGQILFENGRIDDALASYRKGNALRPDSALILTDLARVELATGDGALVNSALQHLQKANSFEKTNPSTWRLLATAYGKQNNMGMSALALAEEAMLGDDIDTAEQQVNRAQNILKEHSPGWLRAQDIKFRISQLRQEKEGFELSPL